MIIATPFALERIFCVCASQVVCLLTWLPSGTCPQLVSIHPHLPWSKKEFPTSGKFHIVPLCQEDHFPSSRVLWFQRKDWQGSLARTLSSALTVPMSPLSRMLISYRGNLESWFLTCLTDYTCSFWAWLGTMTAFWSAVMDWRWQAELKFWAPSWPVDFTSTMLQESFIRSVNPEI